MSETRKPVRINPEATLRFPARLSRHIDGGKLLATMASGGYDVMTVTRDAIAVDDFETVITFGWAE